MGPVVIPIEGERDLVRDLNSKAVLNTNKNALAQYRQRKHLMEKQDEELKQLKDDVSEIKQLLKNILNQNGKH